MPRKANQSSKSIRISKRNYELLRETSKLKGHKIVWLINNILDNYFNEQAAK